MWVRLAARFPIWYDPSLLACYRTHQNSNTGRHFRMAQELLYSRKAIDLMQPLLPPEKARAIKATARTAYARTALANARTLLDAGDSTAARAHIAAALRLSFTPPVIRRALKLNSARAFGQRQHASRCGEQIGRA